MIIGKLRGLVYEKALSRAEKKGDDRRYLSIMFYHRLGYRLHWDRPETLNEIIQWKKLCDRDPLYTEYADKYAVRKHVAETIGEEYLIPLLGVYERPEDIDYSALPDRFVLKCNHGAGYNIICRDKAALDKRETAQTLEKWLSTPFYRYKREYHYKDIKPLILCEQFMKDASSDELNDYKFFCIHGRVEVIQVDYDRYQNHTRNLYSRDWELLDVRISFPNHPGDPGAMPPAIPKMIGLAEKLAKGFDLVRVDLYLINGEVYFGEMTFTPGAGFSRYDPVSFERRLGKKLREGGANAAGRYPQKN